jgi:hypothetical protein
VARAKQTARAEARRRNRLANRPVESVVDEELDEESSDDPAEARSPDRSSRPASRPAAGGSIFQRLTASIRGAYHRPNVREDLRAWRSILVSLPLLAGAALIVGAGLISVAYPGYSGSNLVLQYFVYPPPVGAIFIAGFFATRASYIMGAVLGVIDVAVIALLARAGVVFTPEFVTYALLMIPLDVLFASGVAFYRRFLSSTSSRRAAAPRGGARGKTTAKPARRR